MISNDKFSQAIDLALELHGDQTRKGSAIPYMGHLLGVTSIVIDDGGSESEVLAALLHDGPEDAGGEKTMGRIRDEFGAEVSLIVQYLSDTFEDPKPPWRARKEQYLAELEEDRHPWSDPPSVHRLKAYQRTRRKRTGKWGDQS